MPNTGTKYSEAVAALRAHFVQKINVIAERHKFRQQAQRHNETMVQYVSALCEMLALCNFENVEEDMLRDQIVEKAYSGHIRERLLLEDGLTLNKAIQIANQVESAARDASTLSQTDMPVREVKRLPKREGGCPTSTSGQSKGETKAIHTRKCYRCGSDKHLANSTKCLVGKVMWENWALCKSMPIRSQTRSGGSYYS